MNITGFKIEGLELPWINPLSPDPSYTGGSIGGYPILVYPTKIVIDPDGRIYYVKVGEDEKFYSKLKSLIEPDNNLASSSPSPDPRNRLQLPYHADAIGHR